MTSSRNLARSWPVLVAVAATIVGSVQIVRTYHVFSNTFDEPAHVAAGMEWIDAGRYHYEAIHPPLARVATALGPYLVGVRSTFSLSLWDEGRALLYSDGRYMRNLTAARLGILPFYLIAIWVMWGWAHTVAGKEAAAAAVIMGASLPPILAHAGLATTDMASTALIALALYEFTRLLDDAGPRRAAWFAMAAALALLAKFSALIFLPASCVAILLVRYGHELPTLPRRVPWGQVARLTGLIAVVVGAVIWMGYRFSVGVTKAGVFAPAPEFWNGIAELASDNSQGVDGYIFSQISGDGFWYYFPVAIAVKTPIPFLLLTGIGMAALFQGGVSRRILEPVAAAAAIVAVAMTISNFNIGVRHVLPIYPLMAVVVGFGVMALWRHRERRTISRLAAVALVLWQLGSTWRAHPDYLPWFNALAGPEPDLVLVDSNLDWGQDLLRLADTVHARGIDQLAIAYFGTASPGMHMDGLRVMNPGELPRGWFAVSVSVIKGLLVPDNTGFEWLDLVEPDAVVGKSIRLYNLERRSRDQLPDTSATGLR